MNTRVGYVVTFVSLLILLGVTGQPASTTSRVASPGAAPAVAGAPVAGPAQLYSGPLDNSSRGQGLEMTDPASNPGSADAVAAAPADGALVAAAADRHATFICEIAPP